jgi:hypothetical protein
MRNTKETIAVVSSSNSNNFETMLSFSKNHIYLLYLAVYFQVIFEIIITSQIIQAENFVHCFTTVATK